MNLLFRLLMSIIVSMLVAACSGGGAGSGAYLGSGTKIALSLSSTTVVAGGSIAATTVLTTTKTGFPLNNLDVTYTSTRPDLVHFATNVATNTGLGTITVQTDTSGMTQVVLNIDNSVAIPSDGVSVDISANYAGAVSVVTLKITAVSTGGGPVGTNSIALSLDKASIADNGGQAVATATVTDAANSPVSGTTVSFSVSPQTGPVTIVPVNGGVTDSSGKAYAIITGTTTVSTQTVFIYANMSGILASQPLQITPTASLPPSSEPNNISMVFGKTILQAGEQTLLTATVTDANSVPTANRTVTFSILPAGTHASITPINSGVTDSNGKAYAVVTATTATVIENAIIYASAGTAPNTVTNSAAIQILPPGATTTTLPASSVEITLDKTNILPGGTVLATALINDASGAIVAGENVTFSVVSGPLSIVAPATVTTGTDGKCLAVIQATATATPGYGLIKATTSNGASQTVAIVVAPAGMPQLSLTIAKASIDASDTEVLATVQVKDINGNPVNGQVVDFTNISGPFTIDPALTTVTTGVDGKATTKLLPVPTPFATNILLGMSLTYQSVSYSLVATATVNPAVNLSVVLDTANLDTTGQIIATATATTASGAALPNQVVTFTVTGPATIVGQSATTSTDGSARAVITHDTSADIGNIIVEAAITYGTTTYRAYATAVPSIVSMKLTMFVQEISGTSVTDLPTTTIDGLTPGVNVKANFTYPDGTPVPNQTVTFTALDPGLFWNAASVTAVNGGTTTATTGISGDAFAVAIPGSFPTSGYVHIQAETVFNGITYKQVMPIRVIATALKKTLTLDKTSIVIAPGATGAVNAVFNLLDSQGAPLAGQNVTYSILSGNASISGAATVSTDGNGDAPALITVGPNIFSLSEVVVKAAVTINGITYSSVASITVNPSISLELATDLQRIGSGGTVVATATLKDQAGTPVANQPVTISILAGAASISASQPSTSTDGTARATITAGSTNITQNVLVQVSTILSGVTYTQVTSFQIVTGQGGVLTLSASDVSSSVTAPAVNFGWVQAIPFTLTDGNGNPRANASVTLSVYSQTPGYSFTIESPVTVTTDSNGKGSFNVTASGFTVLAKDALDSAAVVWIATSSDGITAYASQLYQLTGK